jgi:pimeloyl-ACP methyl ester carboxylesterase
MSYEGRKPSSFPRNCAQLNIWTLRGPALILLHGYTQTSRKWRPLIDKLKDKFTIIAPDLPGIGDSDIPKDGSDMKTGPFASMRLRNRSALRRHGLSDTTSA